MHLNMNQVSHTIVMNCVGLVDRQVRFFKIRPHYSVHDSFLSYFYRRVNFKLILAICQQFRS